MIVKYTTQHFTTTSKMATCNVKTFRRNLAWKSDRGLNVFHED